MVTLKSLVSIFLLPTMLFVFIRPRKWTNFLASRSIRFYSPSSSVCWVYAQKSCTSSLTYEWLLILPPPVVAGKSSQQPPTVGKEVEIFLSTWQQAGGVSKRRTPVEFSTPTLPTLSCDHFQLSSWLESKWLGNVLTSGWMKGWYFDIRSMAYNFHLLGPKDFDTKFVGSRIAHPIFWRNFLLFLLFNTFSWSTAARIRFVITYI